jgi:hypothetical protein
MVELLPPLLACGYSYGGVFLNPPLPEPAKFDPPLDTNDLIVLLTRPPLDDPERDCQLGIERSNTTLEAAIFRALRRFFVEVTRHRVKLTDKLADRLPLKQARAWMEFRLHGSYALSGWRQADRSFEKAQTRPVTTMAFACKSRVGADGPSLLCAFGMGGTATLAWIRWLSRSPEAPLRRLLNHQGAAFIMYRIEEMPPLPDLPLTLDFVDEWRFSNELSVAWSYPATPA